MFTKSLFLSDIVHKSVQIYVSEHFSFAEIIHSSHMWGISVILIGQYDYCTGGHF